MTVQLVSTDTAAASDIVEVKTKAKTAAKPIAVKAGVVKAAPKKRVRKATSPIAQIRKVTVGQVIVAIAGGFAPVGSYILAHLEAPVNPMMWIVVAAALLYSAPTLVQWAEKWCGHRAKAIGFAVLLEAIMVFSTTTALSLIGLLILVVINIHSAWQLAAENGIK